MDIYTSVTQIYNAWNKRRNELKEPIERQKERCKNLEHKTDGSWEAANAVLQELVIQSNLIAHFLADLGPMGYAEQQREKTTGSL